MTEKVQIRADLYEGVHSALVDFYNEHSKLFANKLLLKVCETLLPTYTPSLNLFVATQPTAGEAKARSIAITWTEKTNPQLWKFYKSLPHGSRMTVLLNLMNQYAQIVRADRSLLDKIFWEGQANVDQEPRQLSNLPEYLVEELPNDGVFNQGRGAVGAAYSEPAPAEEEGLDAEEYDPLLGLQFRF